MVSPWLTGALGWAFFGPIGGLLGYAAGSLYNAAQRGDRTAVGAGAAAGPEAARNSFIASLLVLTAAMMKADGRASKSELEVVKAFFRRQFGREMAQEALGLLRDLLRREIATGPVCAQIRAHMNYSQRMALLHYLFSIAHADGELHPAEDRLLQRLAAELGFARATAGPLPRCSRRRPIRTRITACWKSRAPQPDDRTGTVVSPKRPPAAPKE
mgnify:CR=1 FL=1